MDAKDNFRVLVIDDNPAIHADIIKLLATKSEHSDIDALESTIFGEKNHKITFPQFEIKTASQGHEGVELITRAKQEHNPFALAFVDIRMPPGWDGIETIEHIWAIDPEIQIVICTAFSDYSWEQTVARLGTTDNLLILKKPFDNVAVRQLVYAMTKKWQLTQQAKKYMRSLETKVQNRTAALEESLSLVKATLNSTTDGVLVVDNNQKITDYNQKFIDLWRMPETILQSKDDKKAIDFVIDQLESPLEFINKIKQLYSQSNASSVDILKFKDGRIFERYSQPQKLKGTPIGRVWCFRDVTERVNLEHDLQYQATHDILTNLPNRALLLDRLEQAIAISARHKKIFSVLFFDLDRFKLFNDSLTHLFGDKLLQAIAERLKETIRESDSLARLGGDEFVLLSTDLEQENNAIPIAKKVLTELSKSFFIEGREVLITASMGISVYPKDGETAEILLRNADIAMYHAKERGKNTYEFYTDEMNMESIKQLDMETQLRNALKHDEFILHYQPQFNLATGQLEAAEALLRWQHPLKGILLPQEFLSYAEETGLILPLGDWVLLTACKQAKVWQEAGTPIRIAVNIASKQFTMQDLTQKVKDVLKESKLDPQYLELEITENVIISNDQIINTINALKELGIKIALDDFGTGYSSLSYLRNLPIDRLKIDRTFIEHIKENTKDESLVRTIIAMAAGLNLKVIAEGVESKAQVNFLKDEFCEEVQGFYFSKPLSIQNFTTFLKRPLTAHGVMYGTWSVDP